MHSPPGADSSECDHPIVSVVVPCFNEQEVIEAAYVRIVAACRSAVGERHQIVFVDDGSRDATWPLIVSLAHQDPRVLGVLLSRNHGHQLALSAGLSFARGERILIIDADLQDPPEFLPHMMKLVDEGADIVYGKRLSRDGETRFKRIAATAFYHLMRFLSDTPIPADTGDFRLITRRVLEVLLAMPERKRYLRGMIGWIGFKQVALPYVRDRRFAGRTKYTLHRMLGFAATAVTAFSMAPLRLAIVLGFIFGTLGLFGILYALASWLTGAAVAGWTSTILVVLIIGSAQFFILGILGEYIGRIHNESLQRPLFVVDQVVGHAYPNPHATTSTLVARELTRTR